MALTSFKQAIMQLGHVLKENSWNSTINFFEKISESSIPNQVNYLNFLIKLNHCIVKVNGSSEFRFRISSQY